MLVEPILTRHLRRAARTYMHMDEGTFEPPTTAAGRGTPPLLYIHIPFCRSLCPFCSFHRVRLAHPAAERYFDALRSEIRRFHDYGFRFEEVYVGGGTPTVLPDELYKTLDLIRSLNRIERISVESNPSDLDRGLLDVLTASGVNRLSVGVQSFDDDLLKRMGRYEPYGSGSEIVRRLDNVRHRIDTVNVDMIFNLPGQTAASLNRDLNILVHELDVDQVSFYPLMAAPAARRAMIKKMGGGPGDNEKRFYSIVLSAMLPRYAASSAWCFSRNNSQIDEYIVDHSEYVGLGSGAFSYLDGTLYSSTFSINGYVERIAKGYTGITSRRGLSRVEQLRYDFLLGLFGLELKKTAMVQRHGENFARDLRKELTIFKLLGAIRELPDRYRLTRTGMYYWVVMMREFFNGVNALREDMRMRIRSERALLKMGRLAAKPAVPGGGQAPEA